MSFFRNIVPALAGSIALNIIHELARKRSNDVPRVNEIAEEGIEKAWLATGNKPPKRNNLYGIALTSDIVANTAFFRTISGNTPKETWTKGLLLGAAAGIGTLTMTEPLGLDDKPVNRNPKVQALTILYYVVGGLVTAGVYNAINRDEKTEISD
ncbi:hypothetical protein [Sphingobacterium haloxyli]|uniref:Uncharacterized protein n=1 Tax=Sphingobacterium haloxyli TaxID=2100533 RepID=A0A2S9J477_9SPHI|nr:hypothetical protein [Sphingobacterium haloxyli]PRD47554.1 hypothetical protein C5745_09555 [Sphingobacterium haloxyli]